MEGEGGGGGRGVVGNKEDDKLREWDKVKGEKKGM